MNVADLELSKELFKLSGWADGTNWLTNALPDRVPAYDAGYLLDKLVEVKTGLTLYHVHSTMQWEAFYAGKFFEYGTDEQHWSTQDSNPANALCLLALELIKQGVLNPKGEA